MKATMETNEFKATMNRVVTECFPDERLAFNECSDELLADIVAGRNIQASTANAGEFAWAEQGLAAGKSVLELVSAAIGIYKIWHEIQKDKNTEDLRTRLHASLLDAGVSKNKIDKVVNVVMTEISKNGDPKK